MKKMKHNVQYYLDALESSTDAQSTKYKKAFVDMYTYIYKVYFHSVHFLNINVKFISMRNVTISFNNIDI